MDWYTSFGKKLSDNDVDFLAATIKCAITTSSYTYSAAHEWCQGMVPVMRCDRWK